MTLKKIPEGKYAVPTQLIYGKSMTEAWDYTHHVIPPLTASSTFRLDTAKRGATGFTSFTTPHASAGAETIYFYDRMGEPNNNMLQHVLAVAEGLDCAVTFGSGMAAVHAASSFLLSAGEHIVSHRVVYGCTYSLFTSWLTRFGIQTDFVDMRDPQSMVPLIKPNTRVIYLESPANPTLELLDLAAIGKLVKEINATRPADKQLVTVIDNTFSTPFCQRPAEHGIDIVLHSLTKGLSGFGTDMGGVVCARKEFEERLILFRKDFGGVLAPQTAWHILTYGVSTLNVRVPKMIASAQIIAEFLEQHPAVERVTYPGLKSYPQHELAQRMLRDYEGKFAPGFMVYFVLKGKNLAEQQARGLALMDYIAHSAYTVTLAVSLGQLRTLIEHPSSMTHSAYPPEEQLRRGLDPGGVRLAIGIEDPADIIRDLDAALAAK